MSDFINIYADEDKVTLISDKINPGGFRIKNPTNINSCVINGELISIVCHF